MRVGRGGGGGGGGGDNYTWVDNSKHTMNIQIKWVSNGNMIQNRDRGPKPIHYAYLRTTHWVRSNTYRRIPGRVHTSRENHTYQFCKNTARWGVMGNYRNVKLK